MRVAALLLCLPALVVACEKTRADEGRDAMLQVEGAQFYRSAMPLDESGPKVVSATLGGRTQAGLSQLACSGELERSATAVAVGLASDVGYWIVPAGIPLSSAPTTPTFELTFGLATTAPTGPHDVVFRAVDGAGHFGPPTVRQLEIAPPLRPSGRLVVSLSWDNQADLDLHVLLPTGVEIFKRNPTEYERPPPSAGPVPPNAPIDGGVLDHDSNARCIFDGRRAENVVWTEAPPKGHYVVRVDTFSLCGAPSAHWQLEAMVDGVRISAARGTSTDNDLRFDHNRGGGVLALEFDVP